MYQLIAAALGILVCTPGMANDLVGIWLDAPPSPEGVVMRQIFTFIREKTEVTGTASSIPSVTNDVKLKRIEVRGDDVSFTGNRGVSWQGKFVSSDKLQVTVKVYGNDGVPAPLIFTRVSPDSITALKATLIGNNVVINKLAQPILRDLPPAGLAPTPIMGWNSWNEFLTSVDEKAVREAADALVATGLRDAGYIYVTIDDGWQGRRDKNGVMHPNAKFPDMKRLSDYIHSKGLKFGIYSSPGPFSCAGYTGSHGHEIQDAQTFADWGVDLLKYDWCSAYEIYKTQGEMQGRYQIMGAALEATARPIVYRLCQYGLYDVGRWGRKVGGNLWRTSDDSIIGERWAAVSARFANDGRPEDAGPGGCNDPDILLIGNGGLTSEEYQTHLTLWVILSAPLVLGNSLHSMTPEISSLLLNKDVVSVDQDALGKQGRRIAKHGSERVNDFETPVVTRLESNRV